ncbi:succinate-semialdehyde dehydrogenase [Niveomyces insectorum RCEF 264]|uniref:Succinate-semialdehyde dehydrogenase, mitochondrial n=1 Tax=Niveomyces insectorum RCEF 264 TaxID=1081102 RepID=A0A167NSJ6_9HYPO|nr:succinate-semialdehyde dehydrogenase [Niveomyces insectorum RCEF 264]
MATHPVLSKLKDASLFIEKGFIDGAWVASSSGETFAVHNPATGTILGTCPDFTVDDTNRAVAAASTVFASFRTTQPRQRARLLRRWFELVVQNADDISILLNLENGKPHAEARGEVDYAANFLEWFSEEAPRIYGDVIPATQAGNQIVTVKEPVGVCALITPWNFPAAMITRKVGAALAAGCTAVIKPAGETPFTANALVELARRAGLPRGVLNVVTAGRDCTPAVGAALTASRLVHKCAAQGTTLKKLSLELGGNAPFVVLDDADLDAAVAGALTSKFRASGQTCVCANRIFVQAGVYDAFAARLAARVHSDLVVGNGARDAATAAAAATTRPAVTQGPLIHEQAVTKADAHVQDAVAKGARVLVGGQRPPAVDQNARGGSFYQPTVLTGMTTDMRLAREETFGPVAGLFRFTTDDEVVQLANSTDAGLAAYIFSGDVQRAWRVARALDVGMVGLNTGLISDVAAPFGGVKSSGFGREGSKYGVDEYVTTKMIMLGGIESPIQSRL